MKYVNVMMKSLIINLFVLLFCFHLQAGEGMWIPMLIDSLNYKDMQEKGLRLTPEEIYNVNTSSIKDAVVIFGNGCTGEIISPEGLLITNHHCGYSKIQAHSTVERDYLKNGFWAQSKEEELANPGLSVTFLVRIDNVTDQVLREIPDTADEFERNRFVAINMGKIKSSLPNDSNYHYEIKPFYYGREYYLFVYEIFNDVRLVGAPAESIGRFGGDTDNWVWPRHTGDFSLFRIYAGKDNRPADYSPDNVPYKPKKYLQISMKGVKEGDFTMVMGYPGRTDEYLISDELASITGKDLPAKIAMRTAKLNKLQEVMDRGPEYKLQYASKYVGISNAWKKWIGVTKGIEKTGILNEKKQLEQNFSHWASSQNDRKKYAPLLDEFSKLYAIKEPLFLSFDIGKEFLNSMELSPFTDKVQLMFYGMMDSSETYKKDALSSIKLLGRSFFKTSGLEIDRNVLPALLKSYADYTDENYHPAFYTTIREDFNNNYQTYVANLFENSIFTDSVRFFRTFKKQEMKIKEKILSDPLVTIYRDFALLFTDRDYEKLDSTERLLNALYRKYLSGLMEMFPEKVFYPDANFTMRLTYGKVDGYSPDDAIGYTYRSTLDGIFEKEDPAISDYKVPQKLREIYQSHNFQPYGENNVMPVCFIATNHTSGGNSGSPVLDADGNLIGINFDRNWEGTVSDYAYDASFCRNISLDIRYVLFIIDKLADADWLLNELTLIKN